MNEIQTHTTDTDEPWKYCEWNMPDTKAQVLYEYNSTYMKVLDKAKSERASEVTSLRISVSLDSLGHTYISEICVESFFACL